MPCGHEAADERGQQRGREREAGDASVDHDRLRARQRHRIDAVEGSGEDPAQSEPRAARDGGEHGRLRQDLARQAGPARAERGPQRRLPAAARRPGQQQARHVDRRHEQERGHRGEDEKQARPHRPDDRVAHRHRLDVQTGHGRVAGGEALAQPAHESVQIRLRLRERDPGAQPPVHVEVLVAARAFGDAAGREREGRPHLGSSLAAVVPAPLEAGGHDPHDLVGLAVQPQGRAEEGGIGAEAPLPEAVPEHDHVLPPRLLLLREECASPPGGCAQRLEEVGRDEQAMHPLGLAGAGQVGVPGARGRDAGEHARLAPMVEEGRGRARGHHVRVAVLEEENALRIPVWELLQEDGVEDAEGRHAGGEGQAQRRDDGEREAGRAPHPPDRLRDLPDDAVPQIHRPSLRSDPAPEMPAGRKRIRDRGGGYFTPWHFAHTSSSRPSSMSFLRCLRVSLFHTPSTPSAKTLAVLVRPS